MTKCLPTKLFKARAAVFSNSKRFLKRNIFELDLKKVSFVKGNATWTNGKNECIWSCTAQPFAGYWDDSTTVQVK